MKSNMPARVPAGEEDGEPAMTSTTKQAAMAEEQADDQRRDDPDEAQAVGQAVGRLLVGQVGAPSARGRVGAERRVLVEHQVRVAVDAAG